MSVSERRKGERVSHERKCVRMRVGKWVRGGGGERGGGGSEWGVRESERGLGGGGGVSGREGVFYGVRVWVGKWG